MTSSVSGRALKHLETSCSASSTRKKTFAETCAIRPPLCSDATLALWQATP